MKKQIISLVLLILLVGVIASGFGCAANKAKEIETLEAEMETLVGEIDISEKTIRNLNEQLDEKNEDIAELEGELAKASTKLEEQVALMARIAELVAQLDVLELNLEELREPPLQVPSDVEVVGTITFSETVDLLRKLFPESMRRISAYTKGPHPLVNLGLVEAFLATDPSDSRYRSSSIDAGDRYAFQFKSFWIEAGLPPWSLGFLKVERTIVTSAGDTKQLWVWRNIFLTVENGEYVVYEVVPQTDELIKIETPSLELVHVIISDGL